MVAKMRPEVENGDQSYKATVSIRYSRFLIQRTLTALSVMEKNLDTVDVVPDKRKFYEYYAGQIDLAVKSFQAATLLMTGQTIVADPVECETAMRVYYAAATPKQAP